MCIRDRTNLVGESGLTYNGSILAVNGDVTLDNGGSAGLNFNRSGVLKADIEIGSASDELAIRARGSGGYINLATGSSAIERLRIDSSGRVIITNDSVTHSTGTNTQYAPLIVRGNTSATSSRSGWLTLARSEASANISANEGIGEIFFGDQQAGEYGAIKCFADAAAAVGDYPGRLSFHTTADGGTTMYERLRITKDGNIEMGSSVGTGADFSLLDGMVINTNNGSAGLLINSSSSSHNAYFGFSYGSGSGTSHNDQFSAYIGRVGDNTLILGTDNNIRWYVSSSGHFYPSSNNTYDVGTSSNRVRNIYVNDLQLSNESKKDEGGNDVDGTWGDWTLQEGESEVFMINNRTGKKYSMMLKEVE